MLSKLNTSAIADLTYSMYISKENEVFITTGSGSLVKSIPTEGVELEFKPEDVTSGESIRKICTGNGFVAIVTDTNKLLTTFNEKSSASSINCHSTRPRELKKFQSLDVLDTVSGIHHILVHAIPKLQQLSTGSSIDEEEEELRRQFREMNRTYTKAPVVTEEINGNVHANGLVRQDSKRDLVSKIPVAESRRRRSKDSIGSRQLSKEESLEDTAVPAEMLNSVIVEKSSSLTEFEALEKQNLDDEVFVAVSPSDTQTVSAIKIESAKSKTSEYNDNKIESAKSVNSKTSKRSDNKNESAKSLKSNTSSKRVTEVPDDTPTPPDTLRRTSLKYMDRSMDHDVIARLTSKTLTRRSATEQFFDEDANHLEIDDFDIDEIPIYENKERLNEELIKDEQMQVELDRPESTSMKNDVLFIDNGIDKTLVVLSDSAVIVDEVSSQNLEDTLLGEKLHGSKGMKMAMNDIEGDYRCTNTRIKT